MNTFFRKSISYSSKSLPVISRYISSTHSLKMPIKVGEKIPSIDLFEGNPGGKVNIAEQVKGKKVVIFGVPGAFTPTCSNDTLINQMKYAKKGIQEIICVSVNDPFVMAAWGEANKASGKVRMLADTGAQFTKAIDVAMDLTGPLGGIRSKRYAMLVEDGVVKAIDVEPDGTGATCSLSNNFVKNL